MRISQLASESGVGIETLRYYERRGLLPLPPRTQAGYRCFSPDSVARVRFIRRAQEIGFTLEEVADLLALWERSATACDEVANRASATLHRIDAKIQNLQRMRSALGVLMVACNTRETLAGCPLLLALGHPEDRVDES